MAADGYVVAIVGERERGDADRVRLDLVVEHPDRLEAVLHVVEHSLVEDDEEVAIGERQAVMRAPTEGRRPVAMYDQLGSGLGLDVDDGEAGVAPGAIGDGVVD